MFLLMFLVVGMTVKAAIPEPGSKEDPIVTKSYVDKIAQELKQSAGQTLEVVYLENGETLIADKGAEIILRSGNATVVGGLGGGLADVTSGKDLENAEVVLKNHLLIVPRDDGRGIKAQTQVVCIVRGNFTVVK